MSTNSRQVQLQTVILCLLSAASYAGNTPPHFSLFFTHEEGAEIETAVRRAQPFLLGQAKHVLHCSSIMYFDEEHWTIWLQGERWTAETDKPNLHIIEVTPEAVRLSVVMMGETNAREVMLHANQSLNLLTGDIIEGIY